MAPPKPKPKPRTELARAAAAASKWAFGTPGLSEKQQAAARRNYDYIQTRLRETGGGTTTAEEQIGKRWQAKREAAPITIPKPKGAKTYKPGDPEYSSDAVLSQAEIQKSAKALRSPKTALAELERQGFQRPTTNAQAQAQAKQLVKKLAGTSRSSLNKALKNPLDVAGNADLVGPKTARLIAEETRKAAPPKPTTGGWGKATAKGIDWLVPERAERALGGAEAATMGITPDFIEAPYRNLKSVTADMAMAFPAIGETIFNDVTGKTHWAIPKMAKEMLVAWGQGIEAATPLPADLRKTLGDVAHGRWDELSADAKKDFQKMAEEWSQRPFTALLNVYPAVSGAARVAEFPTLVRRIAAANPQMSRAAVIRAARKESYVPGYGAARLADPRGGKGIRAGYEGGIPKRILKGKLVDDAGETLSEFKAGARPPSRSALGRKIQGSYDKWSGGGSIIKPTGPVLGRFSELRRASRALQKHNTMEFERSRIGLLQQMAPLESYIRQSGLSNRVKNLSLERIAENRARLSETFYGPSGPPGNVVETLTAVSADLSKLAREGGLDIPTNTLAKINKEIQRVDLKLERYGQTVHTNTGRWAEAQDAMREAGYSQEQIEVNLELASTVARAWAKRKAGRDPSDWIDSPEGRDLVGIEFGTPDAAALKQSLFQVLYPNDADIPEWAGNPYRLNRAAAEAGEEAPVPPPFSTGPATSAKGRPLATHTTRHTEAGQDIRATVDVDGNPLPGADPELLAKVEKQLPQEGRLETTVDGDEVWVGRTTLKQKSDRMLRFFNSLDGDQQELFRRWYERTWDYVAHIYGEEAAQAMGNAFYASQAAQSPAGGIAMLFRIAQEISEGKKLSPNAGFIQKNVWKLMEGEHLGENPKGLAAKLMDFFDSGAGMNMRSLLEGMSEGGPGVVDRWTWRSDGFITPEKGGKAPDMMRARIPGIEADGQLKSTTGKTYGYEYSSMRLQELTTRWNRAGVGGRRDWTIDQIQAIDWFATKQDWVAKKFTPTSAEGGSPLDMALENTREISFGGTPEQLRAAVEEAGAGVEILRGVRGEERALTDVSEGPEGGVHAIVIGAPKVMNRLEETLGKLGQTYSMRYPGQFGGTATQRRHHIDVPRSRKGAASDAVSGWKKKDKPLAVELGEDTVRLDFGTGKTGAARAKEFAGTMGIPEGEITARFSVARGGKPTVLTQRVATGVAGAVQWLDTEGGRQILYLSEHANPSTFAHELFGHASHEMKREFPDEFAKVEQRVGKPLEQWTRDDHEAFATSMERYLTTGKAPTPELQPAFTAMKRWMKTVYETIKALGRPINPETQRLFDRYFGKEPLDFTPPKRLRRTLPQPGDIGAVSKLIDETADILMRGPAVLSNDPASRMRVAGNMKWLEQQVLPFVGEMDSRVAERVHDLFRQFDDVKSGESIFSPDERRLLEARGKLLSKRHGELNKMARSLRAQPDAVFLDRARGVMDDLDNAESLEDIADSIKDLKAVAREADKRTTGDFERQKWLERQVKDLERALKSDRPIDKTARDEAIGALRMISEHMTDIYLDIFGEGLSPEARAMLKKSLEVRDNIIPERLRKLGLLKEGTGSGVYMPHYSVFDKVFSQIRGPVRLPAAGGRRKQLSMSPRKEGFTKKQNRLIRYQTGELLVDPRTLLSAYKQRLRFLETSMLRKQLYDIGVKIPEDPVTGNPRIPEGWYILNGSGKAIPKRLERMAEMSQSEIDDLIASGQDFDSMLSSESGTMEMLQEYRDSWLSKGEIPPEWQNDKLRMVPPEVVETMVGKVFESAPGGAPQAMLGLLSVGGRVATIFSHPIGYIHANVAANAMLLALTNPSRLGRAAMEAMPVMKFLKVPGSLRANHPTLYQTIATLTGDIKAEAGIPNFYVKAQTGLERVERSVNERARDYAGFLGDIADQPFRVASWTGHARKYGFTDPEGWRLLATSDDPEIKSVREIVSQRARDDMLDFNKLTAQEQRMARYLFIWPFIRAAVAQPAWLVREYPARMAAMALAAQGQEEAYKDEGIGSVRSRYNEVAPAEERSMFDINDVPVAGGTVNMNPINPVGPFSEKMSEAYRISHGDFTPVGDVWNPGYTELIKGIFGDRGMDWARVLDSTLPGATFFHAATKAKSRGAQKYTDRSNFWDYIRRREGRFWPEDVDPEKVREAGEKEKKKLDKRPAWEKSHEEDMADYEKIVAAAVAQGKRPPNEQEEAAIKRSIAAYNALDQAEDGMKETTGKVELDERDKIQATYEVVKMYYPEKVGSLPPLEEVLTWPMKKTEGVNDIPSLREDIRSKIRGKRSKLMSRGRDLGLDVE